MAPRTVARAAAAIAAIVAMGAVDGAIVTQGSAGCAAQEQAHRQQVLSKMAMFDVECEEMCKRLGAYPDGCQCPGFAGNPASEGDVRKCIDQYCQDPKTPCPTEAFVTCVDETTKVSALQWASVTARVDASLGAFSKQFSKVRAGAAGSVESCNVQGAKHQTLLQQKLAMMDVKCEEMCKRLGVYPDGCECPGFAGNPASEGDVRKCIDQHCQDPKTPCPTDAFVTCVDETTKVSMLQQWQAFEKRIDQSLTGFKNMVLRSNSNSTADQLLGLDR